MKRRDLLLQRYWRREDDGTYGKKRNISNSYSCNLLVSIDLIQY